jgi:AsmA family/AsmA-like C-terminal region
MTSSPKPEIEPAARPWLHRHFRIALGLGVLALILLLLLIVPPFIGISQYKNHITQLVSASLGRPVRLSSVELRMLPRPGFVLTDLTVEEDPTYGAEPVLHASTVTASIRLFSLWRGKLALDRISVDEASVNLVRSSEGRWNVDSLFRTAAPAGRANGAVRSLPYLEASNSRINVKFGAEKIPFSLTATDASLWHEDDGWHLRMRGQPTRTDIPLDQADTGIVRIEAVMHPAPQGEGQSQVQLSQMPLHVDMDWREAQLGQLSRLILGSDEDWRGDLTGELHADGSAEEAHITTRLRATGVHRAEFAPAATLDFDANCGFVYHYSAASPQKSGMDKIECNSPVGDGRAHLTGSLSAEPGSQQLSLELDRVPVQAPLDLLRTLRGNLDQSLTAQGSLSGKMTYAPSAQPDHLAKPVRLTRNRHAEKTPQSLQGSFTAHGIRVEGQALSSPIEISSFQLQPAPAEPNQPAALLAAISLPAGTPAPLSVTAQFGQQGFNLAIRGSASLSKLRELAHVAGISQADALNQLSGDPAALDLHVQGPWLAPFSAAPILDPEESSAKTISGTVTLRNASWKPNFLATPVDLSAATLRLENGLAQWDGVAFAYGPASNRIKGTATLAAPLPCTSGQLCTPHFTVRFPSLDTATLQAALLGAHEPGTLISSLIDRFRPASTPNWPVTEGTIQADTLTSGPFTFTGATASLRIEPRGIMITSFEGHTLGGQVRGTGTLTVPVGQSAAQNSQPAYSLEAAFTGIKPQEAAQLIGEKWSGGSINGSGTLTISGFTDQDFAASAKGTLSFDWHNGTITQATSAPAPARPALVHFDHWTGSASISDSALTLGENKLHQNGKTSTREGSLTFAQQPQFTLTTPSR